MQTRLKEILSRPTASVPDVGWALGCGRNHAYDCVKRGDIPVLRLGGKLVVPTAWLRKALQLDEDVQAA